MNTQSNFPSAVTAEGAKAKNIKPVDQLRRLVMACMLWEDNFYVNGKDVVTMIKEICNELSAQDILMQALQCHTLGNLRHIPLLLIVEALKKQSGGNHPFDFSTAITTICHRPDQMTELLALYWKDGKKPLASQLKKGLAKAFTQFDAYQLAKWDRDAPIKLRDVLFLCHAKPKDEAQAATWKQLIDGTLPTPDTWETKLSSGQDKKESFTDLLQRGKLGRLATLRNLRTMQSEGVDVQLVKQGLMQDARPLLPFQYLVAAKHCPQWESMIDEAMIKGMEGKKKLLGRTILLVDVSGSMDAPISSKSELTRMDAACAMAILLREVCADCEIFSFSNNLAVIPNRRGMALRDAIVTSQMHGGTYLGNAINMVLSLSINKAKFDRIIVITDEQSADPIPQHLTPGNWIVNVGVNKNGIDYNNAWNLISGFSEGIVDFIVESSILRD